MRKLIPVFLILISACSPYVTGTPPPPPQVVSVSFSPTLRPWRETLHQCANEQAQIALVTNETSPSDPGFWSGDLVLSFGEPAEGVPGYAVSLGEDQIIIIAGENIDIEQLNQAQLRDAYTNPTSPYQAWTYGEGNDLRRIFDRHILDDISLSSEALLAPNPAAMIEAISNDPQAIGYIPQSWVTGNELVILLDDEVEAAFEQPILALTTKEPQGALHSYLACLQNIEP